MNEMNKKLGDKIISPLGKPYIIAEVGVNHEGSMNRAIDLIDLAKEGGANAVKFQSYKAETLASRNSPAYWDTAKEPTTSQFKLFKKYDNFGVDEYRELYQYCIENEIDFLSTPFDDESIEYLYPLMPFYKIASADITNLPFLRKVADKKKPIILSTGASNTDEIELAVKTINDCGNSEISLLHCILNYPTPDHYANLNMISALKDLYPNMVIGYSDHTIPDQHMTSIISAFLLGALIIEKHFTYDKSLVGNDHYHAMDVHDLKNLVGIIDKIMLLKGDNSKKMSIPEEDDSRLYARRSIVLAQDILKGDIISEDQITYKRPGTGISPIFWDQIIGKKVLNDIQADDLLQWEDIEE